MKFGWGLGIIAIKKTLLENQCPKWPSTTCFCDLFVFSMNYEIVWALMLLRFDIYFMRALDPDISRSSTLHFQKIFYFSTGHNFLGKHGRRRRDVMCDVHLTKGKRSFNTLVCIQIFDKLATKHLYLVYIQFHVFFRNGSTWKLVLKSGNSASLSQYQLSSNFPCLKATLIKICISFELNRLILFVLIYDLH